MNVQAYVSLYESSIGFAMRKALYSEQRQIKCIEQIDQLKHACNELEKEVINLENEIVCSIQKDDQLRLAEQKKH